MKSVIERLDDIENTARSIVAKAEEDKSQVEQEIQAQRDQFDKELDEKTQAELTRIPEEPAGEESRDSSDIGKGI